MAGVCRPSTAYVTGTVPSRVAPAPVGSGISFRKLPPPSHEAILASCQHWLSRSRGNYEHPSQRHLFMLAHEVSSLLAPLRAEHNATRARLNHLEAILLQWSEVFGAPAEGKLASPAALASELRSSQSTNESLRELAALPQPHRSCLTAVSIPCSLQARSLSKLAMPWLAPSADASRHCVSTTQHTCRWAHASPILAKL